MRLSVMLALFVAVLLLMQFAKRPETWSAFATKAERAAAQRAGDASVQNDQAPPKGAAPDRGGAWTIGALIIAAVVYITWRIGALSRLFRVRSDDALERWRRLRQAEHGKPPRGPSH